MSDIKSIITIIVALILMFGIDIIAISLLQTPSKPDPKSKKKKMKEVE